MQIIYGVQKSIVHSDMHIQVLPVERYFSTPEARDYYAETYREFLEIHDPALAGKIRITPVEAILE